MAASNDRRSSEPKPSSIDLSSSSASMAASDDLRSSEPSLNSDELFETFSWLPAKSVLRFSALSKTLAQIFSEPLFIKNQSIRSSLVEDGFFLQPASSMSCLEALDFHVLPWTPPLSFGVPRESIEFSARKGRIIAAGDGLLLLNKIDDGGFLICNPATRRWAPLSAPCTSEYIHHADHAAMVVCHASNDLVVVIPVLVEDRDDAWSTTYCLAVFRGGRWEEETYSLNLDGRELRLEMPIAVYRESKGLVVHYLCDSLPNVTTTPVYNEPYIAAFEVERKAFSRAIKLPKGAWKADVDVYGSHERLRIFKWGTGSICLVRTEPEGEITVWVLENYEAGSWRSAMSMTVEEMGLEGSDGCVVAGCCVVNGNCLVLATASRVYCYAIDGDSGRKAELVAEHGYCEAARINLFPYANTLRPVCQPDVSSFSTSV